MLLKDTLKIVANDQRKQIESIAIGIERAALKCVGMKLPQAAIISGIRRCGKSTLLRQIMKMYKNFYYFNFEDQRITGFDVSDYEKLDDVLHEEFGQCKLYFFDEIQNVPEWERFVRKKQDEGNKFVITGSNASLLSRELGTRLTGRHITYELFPFSYTEMLAFCSLKPSTSSFEEYMKNGGFPEFLKYKKAEILQNLFNDIIMRDIVVRYGIREAKIIKEMAIFLLSNIGKEFSYTSLAKTFNLGSTNTAVSYVSYFEDSYFMFTVPRFDYSYKKQIVNPKKIYCIDSGMVNANSVSLSEDFGRVLENVIFMALRQKYKSIFYFKKKCECDFLIKDKGKIIKAVQVCYSITEDNKEREISGLQEAMKELKLKKGTIVTLNQDDKIGGIDVKPAWKFLLEL